MVSFVALSSRPEDRHVGNVLHGSFGAGSKSCAFTTPSVLELVYWVRGLNLVLDSLPDKQQKN